jgi:hypothetical protein
MSFGGSSSNNEAKQARQDEDARQERIRQGTSRINDIFNGSVKGVGSVGDIFDPNSTYYNNDGSVWKPLGTSMVSVPGTAGGAAGGAAVRKVRGADGSWEMVGGQHGSNVGSTGTNGNRLASGIYAGEGRSTGATKRAMTPEEEYAAARGGLHSGKQFDGGFTDEFFNTLRQNYINYATPQLEDQHSKAEKELTFSLARSGNLNSSVRGQQAGELQQMYDLNKQKVADDALAYETTSRTGIEDARANLIQTLNATGDAEGAANSALARANALSKPSAYSPLSQLFSDFTAGLGAQAAQERAEAASGGSYSSKYNTGLFGNAGRVKVSA